MFNTKKILTAFIASLVLVSTGAIAQTFKVSTLYPDGTAVLVELKKASKDIEAKTEGRVKFKFYPGGVMGNDQAVFAKIRRNQLHGSLTQGGAVAQFFKDSQVYNVPLAFNSFDEVDYVRSKMDKGLMQGLEDSGWVTFGLVDGGFAYAMTKQPVANVDDLRQQKLWLPANDPASEKAATAFELKPIVMNIGEVLTSLQTGAINAIAAPPVAALTLQWHSKVDYMTDVPLLYTYGLLTLSKKAFVKVSPEDQKVTREVMGSVFAKLDALNRKDNIAAFDAMKQQGVKVVDPTADDVAQWKTYAETATKGLVAKGEFSQEILDTMQGHLNDFRKNKVAAN